MTLLESLLDAIVRLDGDALVMHVGEKPYVVTTSSAMNAYRGPLAWGQVELSSRVLTPDAVMGMVAQILPVDQRHALEDIGAVEHEIQAPAGVRDRFTVVAARGGDDIWLELRRHAPPVEFLDEPVEGMADAAAAAPAAAATDAAVSVPGTSSAAVALHEAPPPPEAPAPAAPEFDESPAMQESAQAAAPVADTRSPTFEERVPVLDEVGDHPPEHVEHIRIPLAAPGERAPETELELVEPEMQHAPTDEDVDAMLAATAAALLTAGIEPGSGAGPGHDEPLIEIVPHDEEEQVIPFDLADSVAEAEFEAEGEAVDLTAELDEIPVAPWAPSTGAQEAEAEPPAAATFEPELMAADVEPGAEQMPEFAIEEAAWEVPARDPVTTDIAPEASTRGANEAVSAAPAPTAEPAAPDAQRSDEPLISETPVEHPAGIASRTEQPAEQPIAAFTAPAPAAPAAPEPAPRGPVSDAVHSIAASAAGTPHRAIAVPIARSTAPGDKPAAGGRVDDEGLLHVLRAAAERGATTVYVVAQSRPMIRVDGEISPLENALVLSTADIDRLVAALAPGRAAGDPEWISEVPQVGRVRCVSFNDHRGPGLIFRIVSTRTISAEHLNLPPEIRELCAQSDGLVMVTGARGSGKSTLIHSFVDLINRTRADHMITIESEIAVVHEGGRSFISQREVPDDRAARAAAIASALREDPDVIVIEDVQTPEAAAAALEAAGSGRLVIVSLAAPSSIAGLETFVNLWPAESRGPARAALASALRGVVGQLLVRRAAGGRAAARELLVNSPAVSAAIREGKAAELGREQLAGHRFGMMTLAESLGGLVRSGSVHGAEAYRRAPDRAALLAVLARDGVDTTFAERLA